MSSALTAEAAGHQRAKDPGVRRDYHIGVADNIDDSSEKPFAIRGVARANYMLNRKNRAETDFSSGEAMREFVSFLRHFVYFIHFVRGVLIALLIMVIIGCVLLMETEGFSFGTAVYVTAITALTVGYGDITPKTATGQVVSVAIGFIGVLFNGLIVAIATRALAHAAEDKGKIGSAQPPAGEGGET